MSRDVYPARDPHAHVNLDRLSVVWQVGLWSALQSRKLQGTSPRVDHFIAMATLASLAVTVKSQARQRQLENVLTELVNRCRTSCATVRAAPHLVQCRNRPPEKPT